jgi:glycosyltransferase involved in cell wall biosynthesis
MRILLVSQLYRPEFGAAVRRMDSIVAELTARGHDVRVATGMPNYPTGVVPPPYKGRLSYSEQMNGARVYRTASYICPKNKGKIRQLLSYLSLLPGLFLNGLRSGRADVVFVTSPPLFNAIPAILLAFLWRAKLVVDLRDLWPDEFVSVLKSSERSLFIRSMRLLERWSYRAAAKITCTTRAFMDTLAERGVDREKLVFAPNGADVGFFTPQPRDNPIAAEYPLGDRFVVTYSGLLGLKYGMETILEAAKKLADEPEILFFIRGAGPKREALLKLADDLELTNVVFGDERPLEDIPFLLARADLCVSCLLPDPYFDKILSVKLFEYLACEKPVVAALGGEGARLLEESGAGIAVTPGDADAMAEAIRVLYRDPERLRRMAASGRPFILKHYHREVIARRIADTMESLCAPSVRSTSFKIQPDAPAVERSTAESAAATEAVA